MQRRVEKIIVMLGLFGIAIWKTTLGMHSDEAYCIALGDMIAKGNSFFKECWSSLQMSAFFTAPVICIYRRMTGNGEGILLLFRLLSVCVQTVICLYFYGTFKDDFKKSYVMAASLILFTFMPDFQSFTYKQEIIWFAVLEVIFYYNYFVTWKRKYLFLLGIMISGSVLAYPTTVLQLPLYIYILYILHYNQENKDRKVFIKNAFMLTGVCVASAIAFFCIIFRQMNLDDFIQFFPKVIEDDNLDKSFVIKLVRPLIKFVLLGIVTIGAILLCGRIEKRLFVGQTKKRIIIPVTTGLLCLSFIGQILIERKGITWHCLTYPYSLTIFILPLLYLKSEKNRENGIICFLFELSAIGLVFCMALASNQGNITSMYGTVLSTAGLILILGNKNGVANEVVFREKRLIVVSLCFFALSIYCLLVYEQESVMLGMGTRTVFMERTLVMNGPAKGLRLSDESYKRYNNLCDVIAKNTLNDDQVFIIDDVYTAPYGYLSLKGDYATFSPQGSWRPDTDKAVQYFISNPQKQPTVVVVRLEFVGGIIEDFLEATPIGNYLMDGDYNIAEEEKGYVIFRKIERQI